MFRPAALAVCLSLVPFAARAQTPGPPVVVVPSTAVASPLAAQPALPNAAPYNERIRRAIDAMPKLQGYAVSHAASVNLARAVGADASGLLTVTPAGACPSYCSGATYLVFLKTVADLRLNNLRGPALKALAPENRRDGEAIWGRWNANGPGTARLFSELNLGPNFSRFEDALPGDFMKVFWTEAIGKSEHGHSVIYLGSTREQVTFWSSNQKGDQGAGYGVKTVPRAKIARVLFSRLEHPENLARAAALPPVDDYLASLLRRETTPAEMAEKCHLRDRL